MLQQTHFDANPFAMMIDPARVIAAVESSVHLSHLESRICRPLDTRRHVVTDLTLASYDDGIDSDLEPAE